MSLLPALPDCGRDAHAHVRHANHRRNGGGYNGDHAGFVRFHAERRQRLVVEYLNGLQETKEVRLQVLQACERELRDLQVDVAEVQRAITPPEEDGPLVTELSL